MLWDQDWSWGCSIPQLARQINFTIEIGLTKFSKGHLISLGALVGLVLSFPFILLSMIAIKLDDGGPAFFSQTRVGENGRRFQML